MGSDPNSREARQQRFAHFTELAIISVQEIVDFAKQVPGFLQLSREDQIALLKASTIEVNEVPGGPNLQFQEFKRLEVLCPGHRLSTLFLGTPALNNTAGSCDCNWQMGSPVPDRIGCSASRSGK